MALGCGRQFSSGVAGPRRPVRCRAPSASPMRTSGMLTAPPRSPSTLPMKVFSVVSSEWHGTVLLSRPDAASGKTGRCNGRRMRASVPQGPQAIGRMSRGSQRPSAARIACARLVTPSFEKTNRQLVAHGPSRSCRGGGRSTGCRAPSASKGGIPPPRTRSSQPRCPCAPPAPVSPRKRDTSSCSTSQAGSRRQQDVMGAVEWHEAGIGDGGRQHGALVERHPRVPWRHDRSQRSGNAHLGAGELRDRRGHLRSVPASSAATSGGRRATAPGSPHRERCCVLRAAGNEQIG